MPIRESGRGRARRIPTAGGGAGRVSCAARHGSSANCGLPSYVGNVIRDERRLLVAPRESFRECFNADEDDAVRREREALAWMAESMGAVSVRVGGAGEGSRRLV